MTLQEESRLSFYKKIADISTHANVVLVQHTDTRQVFVRKELTVYEKGVYDYLMAHPARFFPKIYECIESDGRLILIEEYVQGRNLEEYLDEKGKLSEAEAVSLMQHVCYSLMSLHGLNPPIIHRDLKPSNILLANDGRILLIDFNAARNFDGKKDADTVIIGTKKYAAPEQYGYAQTDARTDVYALGVILNRMLTGKYPSKEVYPGKMGDIIRKCIQFDPAARYQSVGELMRDLSGKGRTDAAYANAGEGAFASERDAYSAYGKKKKSRRQTRIWFLPPGFRTLRWWKMLLGAIYYAFLWNYGLTLQIHTYAGVPAEGKALWVNRIAVLVVGMLWPFLWFNYGGIHRHLPLMKKRSVKWIGYVLYSFIIMFGALIVVVLLEKSL